MFETHPEDLKDMLHRIHEGKLQLPDFQRDYVWSDEAVRSLIASVARGFPVGALLTLRTGGPVTFKPRLLAGVKNHGVEPEELLLDGQQRMTSLYQAAFTRDPVRTRTAKGKAIQRYYFLDIKNAVEDSANIVDAIVGVPADKIVRSNFGKSIELDLSSQELEFTHDMFPLNQVFNSLDWYFSWRNYWKEKEPDRDVSTVDETFFKAVLKSIEAYKMPIIRLDKRNSREAICLVFEKVNVGGKKLDAFELETAIYAAENYRLRDDWSGPGDKSTPGRLERIIGSPHPRNVLSQVANTDFLQACTLLHTRQHRIEKAAEGVVGKDLPAISCKRDALLNLPLTAYQAYADAVEDGFREAGAFLNEQKIVWHRDVPYPPLIVGLAATSAILGKDAATAAAKQKLAQWFWCVTLGELYGSSTESRLARDVPELVEWINGDGDKPRALEEAIFQQERLRSLRTRLAAAYKGIHALLMRRGCEDFITKRPTDIMTFFHDRIDIHHIFPRDWCKKKRIPAKEYDSIVNKTPLSKASNIVIGGRAPSVYLTRIQEKQGTASEELNGILRTHLIEPEYLRNDDFEGFFAARSEALSGLIEDAMGKPVVRESGSDEPEEDVDDVDEELADLQEAV